MTQAPPSEPQEPPRLPQQAHRHRENKRDPQREIYSGKMLEREV
eukprot:CAMPEP_0182561610 /NCGR_PEP_ID=MMETSP1324-20130603/4067_1 /TAXON_ID=236786 /ORGANISM="Florenciella sp., Strain RCC1587" /LENGTH=43 /DNA_ID= /DNA_START= /DNA_END= /DNA_ORIENTATION=